MAWFRDKGSIPGLGGGSGLSQATSCRYIDEVIGVLAGRAPGPREALERALAEGTPYVILDGKIVDSDRCREKTVSCKGREIDLWYSGKKRARPDSQTPSAASRRPDRMALTNF